MNKMKSAKKYRAVGLGGTFDHFHEGHAWFLQQAALLSDLLIVGITSEKMLTQKSHELAIEPVVVRQKNVQHFLKSHHIKHEIVPLNSVEGPTLTDPRIEAVILTEDTERGGAYINQLRLAAGLSRLPVEVIPMKLSENQENISSQNVRTGSHNRLGVVYATLFDTLITLDDTQRQAMRIVQGELVDLPDDSDVNRYLVGDSTLRRFLNEHSRYDMAIIDGKEQREPYFPLVIDRSAIDLVLVNPAGSITSMLTNGLRLALRQKLAHLFVDGEEDLAAVVLQLLLPLGSTIYYGQPNEGLVRWLVTEASKEKTASLLNPHFQTNPKLVE